VTDPLVLSGLVDAMLLVASTHETTKRALHRAVELLTQVNAPLMGTVLNEVGPERAYADGYTGYAYYQRRATTGEEAAPNEGPDRRRVRSKL
jgi:Mrp family chromosome partitioning ATPase